MPFCLLTSRLNIYCLPPVNKIILDEIAVDSMTVNKMTVDEMPVYKISVDEMPVYKMVDEIDENEMAI